MGHERIGILPRTKPWRIIIEQIGSFSSQNENISSIARQTIRNVRTKFESMESDSGVQASFEFLVKVSYAFQKKDPINYLIEENILDNNEISPLKIAKSINKYVSGKISSTEYASFAQAAAVDAMSQWFMNHLQQENNLFQDKFNPIDILKRTSNGSGFCELSRLYFSKFTERYLKYFLEREASSKIHNIEERDRFNEEINKHIEMISKHAFETSKITQSFAAGWFNKNVTRTFPSNKQIKSFLSIAFGKMKGELLREEMN